MHRNPGIGAGCLGRSTTTVPKTTATWWGSFCSGHQKQWFQLFKFKINSRLSCLFQSEDRTTYFSTKQSSAADTKHEASIARCFLSSCALQHVGQVQWEIHVCNAEHQASDSHARSCRTKMSMPLEYLSQGDWRHRGLLLSETPCLHLPRLYGDFLSTRHYPWLDIVSVFPQIRNLEVRI